MKIAKKKPIVNDEGGYKVRLRIDHRTVITVRSPEALKNWKSRYPNAIEVL